MQGEFRRDLYYRIRGQVIYIPGLRERVKDIRPIAEGIAKRYGKVLTEASFRNLENYSWPGNVRELEYCIRRACVSENREINIQEIEFDV